MSMAENLEIIAENVPKVYEAGKKSEYDAFWDEYQSNGSRRNYKYGFAGVGWDDSTFNPKYDIVASTSLGMFQEAGITDLVGILNRNNVKLTITSTSAATNIFYGLKVTELPELDFSSVASYGSAFYGCTALTRIEKIKLHSSGNQSCASAFYNCSKLTDITFEGVIGRDMNLSACPLTVSSLKSVIQALKQCDAYTYTVTFKSSAFSKLEAEGATAEYNGVACTWAELIDNKKWNLTLA